MPNHVKHEISEEVARLMFNDDGVIDFNTIVPMAKTLHDPDPQHMELRAKAALGLLTTPKKAPEEIKEVTASMEASRFVMDVMDSEINKEDINLLISAIANYRDYGHFYWYDWAIDNWGTKWNAYEQCVKDKTVSFETAWSHPKPVFIALSKKHPDLEIIVRYADEDLGSNAMELTYKAGAVKFSKELSFRECFELNNPGERLEDCGYDELGNYDEDKGKREI